MNLTKFVDGLKQLPEICGWIVGNVTLEEMDEENYIEVLCDIHRDLLKNDDIYTSFYNLILDVRSIFGNALIDSEIHENDSEHAPYFLDLIIKYKKDDSSNQTVNGEDK